MDLESIVQAFCDDNPGIDPDDVIAAFITEENQMGDEEIAEMIQRFMTDPNSLEEFVRNFLDYTTDNYPSYNGIGDYNTNAQIHFANIEGPLPEKEK